MLKRAGTLIVLFGLAGAVLAGCGSSTLSGHAATETVPARQTPPMSNPDTGGAKQQSSHPAAALGQLPAQGTHATGPGGRSKVTTAKVVKARRTPSVSSDDHSITTAGLPNPCRLVRLSEAQAITGGLVTKMIEAPLGPTCIYRGSGHAAGITLAVETESFGAVTRHMHARTHVVISGHSAVCGRLGTPMLFVPLNQRQLLNVTAPCSIAQRFATLAVGRLTA